MSRARRRSSRWASNALVLLVVIATGLALGGVLVATGLVTP